jgi:hypothetical protein
VRTTVTESRCGKYSKLLSGVASLLITAGLLIPIMIFEKPLSTDLLMTTTVLTGVWSLYASYILTDYQEFVDSNMYHLCHAAYTYLTFSSGLSPAKFTAWFEKDYGSEDELIKGIFIVWIGAHASVALVLLAPVAKMYRKMAILAHLFVGLLFSLFIVISERVTPLPMEPELAMVLTVAVPVMMGFIVEKVDDKHVAGFLLLEAIR